MTIPSTQDTPLTDAFYVHFCDVDTPIDERDVFEFARTLERSHAGLVEALEQHYIESLSANGDKFLKEKYAVEARLERLRGALERIMHARGDPSSPVTNMGRAMMREIAGQALEDDRKALADTQGEGL